jgi:hypothetical protein
MNSMLLRFITATLVLAVSNVSAEASPRYKALAPSSPWTIDYADDSCRLLRSFGTGREAIKLRFERFAPSETFRMSLIGQPLKSKGALYTGLKLGFRPGPSPAIGIMALSGTSEGAKAPMLMAGAWTLFGRPTAKGSPLPTPDEERRVVELTIDQNQEDADFILALGAMDKPMAALRTCTDELLTHWGLDATSQRNLKQGVTPTTTPGAWLRPEDYPRDKSNSGGSAVVNFRLIVDAQGVPKSCALQGGTDGATFHETTCRLLMERARFSPALDSNGKPVESYYVNAVSWVAY